MTRMIELARCGRWHEKNRRPTPILLLHRGQPISRTRTHFQVRTRCYTYVYAVIPALQLVVGTIGNQVLVVQFAANLLYTLLQVFLANKRVFFSAAVLGVQLHRI